MAMSRSRVSIPVTLLAATLLLFGCQQQAQTGAPAAPKEQAPKAAATEAPKPAAEAPKAAAPKEQAAGKPAAPAAGGTPIRVGVIAERTGALSVYGEAGARAVEVIVDDLNAQGGILGRKVEVVIRDSKSQQDEAVRVTRELLVGEKVDFLIHNISSAECLSVSDVAREAKKIVFSSCIVDDFTGSKGHRYAFRVPNITSRTQGMAAAKYAGDNLKNVKTVYTIANDFAAGHSVTDFFKNTYKQLNPSVQFVGEAWPKVGETDFSSYITDIQNKRPDATFYFFTLAIPFFNQSAPIKLYQQTQFISAYWGGVDEIGSLKQEMVPEGALAGGVPWYAIKGPLNQQLRDKYKAKVNQNPNAAVYWQQMTWQFLTEGIKKAGTIDTEKVVDAMEGMELETVLGPTRMRAFDHQGATPYWIGKAKWDPDMKLGVLTDLIQLQSEQFLPTADEVKKLRGQ